MWPTETQRKEAQAYTSTRFKLINRKTTYTSRCYEEWYEIWETKDGTPVTNEDIEAFKLQPQGQGHGVSCESTTQIRLDCVCDSGD